MGEDEKWLVELIINNIPQYIIAWAACQALKKEDAPNKSSDDQEADK